jgi:AraC-like DNA-binding protein
MHSTSLLYLNKGIRHYGDRPLTPYCREVWEFQVILAGRGGPSMEGSPFVMSERTFWIFPPDHVHGWSGIPGETCEVAVFHFSTVPLPIMEKVSIPKAKGGDPALAYFKKSLSPLQCRQIREWTHAVERDWLQPRDLSPLRFEKLLLDLSLLALESETGSALRNDEQRVDLAIGWYLDHLSENPSLDAVAESIHCSSAHLRRLFHRVKRASPWTVLNGVRLRQASALLQNTNETLESVGEACGFGSGSDFSRAFRREYGVTPSSYRKK